MDDSDAYDAGDPKAPGYADTMRERADVYRDERYANGIYNAGKLDRKEGKPPQSSEFDYLLGYNSTERPR